MKKRFTIEITLGVILIILVMALLDPFMILMPSAMVMTLMLILVIGFVVFAAYIWREQARDEREELHRLAAGRYGWLAGTGILLLGLIYQGLIEHSTDPWLVYALAGMILAKLITRAVFEIKH